MLLIVRVGVASNWLLDNAQPTSSAMLQKATHISATSPLVDSINQTYLVISRVSLAVYVTFEVLRTVRAEVETRLNLVIPQSPLAVGGHHRYHHCSLIFDSNDFGWAG